MNIESVERFEILMVGGMMGALFIFFTILAIVCFAISSKKKKTDPGDSKTWKTLGFILAGIDLFMIIGVVFAIIVPAMLSA